MNILRTTFIAAAVGCGAAWLVKMVAIATTGGADTDSAVVAVLWAVGMLSFLVAAAIGTALLLAQAPTWARWVAAVLAVPVAFALLSFLDTAVKAAYSSDGWFRDELSLVLAGVVMAAIGFRRLAGARA